jgi:TetR/AcrR family transcriptional regulator, cholesterol catabolism regulator
LAGVRVARKQATRDRVIAAARDLFVEVGYDAATIRMIAQRAGVAIGSVFTTFPSKLEILKLVMEERLDRLYGELDGIMPHLRGSVCDRLCSIMAVHYDFEMKRPRLFTAYLAANFEWNDGPAFQILG